MQLEKMDWSFNMADNTHNSQDGRNQNRPKRQQGRGGPQREEKQFDERVLNIDRVARVVKGGRRFRFRALVAIGDNKGKVGVGVAKGQDVVTAISKATDVAKKNIVDISLYNGTIPHEELGVVGGAKILLKPAAPGTGLISGGVVRVVLEVAGVQNVLSKSLGSNNKINLSYATVEALKAMVPKEKWHTTKVGVKSAKPKSTKKTTAKKPAKKKA
jgi:small subunit ribosomal protein S5